MGNIGRGGYDPTGANLKVWKRIQKKKKAGLYVDPAATIDAADYTSTPTTTSGPGQQTVFDPGDVYDQSTSEGRGMAALDVPGIGSPFIEGSGVEASDEFWENAATAKAPNAYVRTYEQVAAERRINDFRFAYRKLHGGLEPTPYFLAQGMSIMTQVDASYPEDEPSESRRKRYENLLRPLVGEGIRAEQLSGLLKGQSLDLDWISPGFVPATGMHTVGMQDFAQPDANVIADTLAYVRSPRYAAEVADQDISVEEQMQHLAMAGDVLYVKQELADRERRAYEHLGGWKGTAYDPNSAEWDDATDMAYRQYLFFGQLKYLIGHDEVKKNKALGIITGKDSEGKAIGPSLLVSIYGDRAQVIENWLRDIEANMADLHSMPQVQSFFYFNSIIGRPFGTTETKARWDYADTVGMRNLPAGAQAKLQAEQTTVAQFLMEGVLPVVAAPVMAPLMWGPGMMEHESELSKGKTLGSFVSGVNGVVQNLNKIPMALGTAAGWLEARPMGTLYNMIGLAIGTHEEDENGQIVPKQSILEGGGIFDLDFGKLADAEAWSAGWNTTQGTEGNGLQGLVGDFYLLMGKDYETADDPLSQLIGITTAWADFYVTLKVAGKMDKATRKAAVYGKNGMFATGRKLTETYQDLRRSGGLGHVVGQRVGQQTGSTRIFSWDIFGMRENPNNGVSETLLKNGPEGKEVWVDTPIAGHLLTFNNKGYRTHQSHAGKEGHPAGADARKAAPYVEFINHQLPVGARSTLEVLAKDLGLEVEGGKALIDTGYADTTIIRGDLGKIGELAEKVVDRGSESLANRPTAAPEPTSPKVFDEYTEPVGKGKYAKETRETVAEFKANPSKATFDKARYAITQYLATRRQAVKTVINRAGSEGKLRGKSELADKVTKAEEELARIQAEETRFQNMEWTEAKEAVAADEGLLSAPDRMFETDEFIAEGQQAGLDMAIDTTAKKTEPFAPPPMKGPEQMPGQTAIGEGMGETFTTTADGRPIPEHVREAYSGFAATNGREAADRWIDTLGIIPEAKPTGTITADEIAAGVSNMSNDKQAAFEKALTAERKRWARLGSELSEDVLYAKAMERAFHIDQGTSIRDYFRDPTGTMRDQAERREQLEKNGWVSDTEAGKGTIGGVYDGMEYPLPRAAKWVDEQSRPGMILEDRTGAQWRITEDGQNIERLSDGVTEVLTPSRAVGMKLVPEEVVDVVRTEGEYDIPRPGNRIARIERLKKYTEYGEDYDRIIAERVADSERMWAEGDRSGAEHWLTQAEARLEFMREEQTVRTPPDEARIEELQAERAELEHALEQDASLDYGVPTAASPDVAFDYASVKAYIKSAGGFKSGPEARTSKGTSLPEQRSASHGLVQSEYKTVTKTNQKTGKKYRVRGAKKKADELPPRKVDELIDELVSMNPGLPFRDPVTGKGDVNAFWEWMDEQRLSGGKAQPKRMSVKEVEDSMTRLDEINAEIDALNGKPRLVTQEEFDLADKPPQPTGAFHPLHSVAGLPDPLEPAAAERTVDFVREVEPGTILQHPQGQHYIVAVDKTLHPSDARGKEQPGRPLALTEANVSQMREVQPATAELYAGTGVWSEGAAARGATTKTFDIDPTKKPDVVMDVKDLKIEDLPENPAVIWLSPECRSFSNMAVGKHWEAEMVQGPRAKKPRPKIKYDKNGNLIPKSAQAREDLATLQHVINIIKEVMRRNPDCIIYLENPMGMMRKSGLPEQLGLTLHEISYDRYGELRMKPTDVWTNDPNWVDRGRSKTGSEEHIAAPRGSKTPGSVQGTKSHSLREKLPDQLVDEVLDSALSKGPARDYVLLKLAYIIDRGDPQLSGAALAEMTAGPLRMGTTIKVKGRTGRVVSCDVTEKGVTYQYEYADASGRKSLAWASRTDLGVVDGVEMPPVLEVIAEAKPKPQRQPSVVVEQPPAIDPWDEIVAEAGGTVPEAKPAEEVVHAPTSSVITDSFGIPTGYRLIHDDAGKWSLDDGNGNVTSPRDFANRAEAEKWAAEEVARGRTAKPPKPETLVMRLKSHPPKKSELSQIEALIKAYEAEPTLASSPALRWLREEARRLRGTPEPEWKGKPAEETKPVPDSKEALAAQLREPHKARPEYAQATQRGRDAEEWALEQAVKLERGQVGEQQQLGVASKKTGMALHNTVFYDVVMRAARRRALSDLIHERGYKADINKLLSRKTEEVNAAIDAAGLGEEFTNRINNHLADILEEYGKIERRKAPVEPGTSFDTQTLNDYGYGVWKTTPDTVIFVPFLWKDNAKARHDAINDVAAKTGATVDRKQKMEVDGRQSSTVIVTTDNPAFFAEQLAKQSIFSPAYKASGPEPPARPPAGPGRGATPPGGGAVPPAGGAPPVPSAPSQPAPPAQPRNYRYPWYLSTPAEIIAYHVNAPHLNSFIGELLHLADDPKIHAEQVAKIDQMIASRDPQEVARLINEVTNGDVDGMTSNLAYNMRVRMELRGTKGNLPKLFRAMTTYVPYDSAVPEKNTAHHLMNFALITGMGKSRPTAADYEVARRIADKAWRSTDPWERQDAIKELDRIVEHNMKEEGRWDPKTGKHVSTWDDYMTYKKRIRFLIGRSAMELFDRPTTHRRTYGEGDKRRVTQNDAFDIEAEIEGYKARLQRQATTAADRTILEEALKAADERLKQFEQDARTWNDYMDGKITYEQAKFAGARLEALADPAPVNYFQLKKHLTHDPEMNPRMMATFQAGLPARAIAYGNAAIGDRVMRVWKSMVMASLGFPVRVNVGDEFFRLIPEGLGNIPRFTAARKEAKAQFGGKSLGWMLAEKVSRGKLGKEKYRNLNRFERQELAALRRKGNALSKEERKTLGDLEAKAEGTAERGISDMLFDRLLVDYAEYFGDDWVLAGPKDGYINYPRAMQDYLHQLSKESYIKAWVNEGMRDMDPTVRAAIEQATEGSKQGIAVLKSRGIMDANGVIRDRQAFDQLVDYYVATVERLSQSPQLKAAMESGRISMATLSKVLSNSPEVLWEIPVRTGYAKRTGAERIFRSPSKTFYEELTLPLMGAINGKLRETFFADRYLREAEKLRKQGMSDPAEIHDVASQRALEYVNDVTFSRRTTVFEDVSRNLIPFIASYRQFMVYWLRTFVKHPFAMSAAYTYNPLASTTFWDSLPGGFSAPMAWTMPFWMQPDFENPEERGLWSIAKQSIPNGNPFILGLGAAPITDAIGGADLTEALSKKPGLSGMNRYYAPLDYPMGDLYYALSGQKLFGNIPMVGRLTEPINKKEARHQDIYVSLLEGVTEPWKATEARPNGPGWYDVLRWLHVARPEALLTVGTKAGSPMTMTFTTPQMQAKYDGNKAMAELKTAKERAKYRQDNPWYDDYLKVTEEDVSSDELKKILKAHPDLIGELVGSTTATGWVDTQAFREQVLRGEVTYKPDAIIDKEYADLWVQVNGGHMPSDKQGGYTVYGGDIERQGAEKAYNAKLRKAKALAKQAAKDIAGGSAAYRATIMGFWEDSADVDPMGNYILHPALTSWARAKGINPQEMNLGEITRLFEAMWGDQDLLYGRGPSDTVIDGWVALVDSGLIPKHAADKLAATSSSHERIVEAAVQSDVDTRKRLYSTKQEETFKLKATDLQAMGFRAGKAFDLAMYDVREFYYAKGGWDWCKNRYGYSAKETKAARQAYFAYRDKRMSKVEGGEAVTGGLTRTLAIDKYFTQVPGNSFGTGPKAETEEKLWNEYQAECAKLKPDLAKIREIKTHFDAKLRGKMEERARIVDWVAAIAVASDLRHQLRTSYSDYYGGPGNSAASNAGTAAVAKLERLIKSFYTDENGEERKGSLFGRDIKLYFTDAHGLAYKMLNWTYN